MKIRARALPWLLLVAAFNSEKVIYWIPIVGVAELLRDDGAPRARRAIARMVRVGAPTLVYLGGLAIYMRGASTDDSGAFVEQLHRMAFTWQAPHVDDPVAAATTFQMLWFPFGPFTIFALLALTTTRDRSLRALVWLLVPIMGQVLIAHDAQRMAAYAFIVYLPLGAVYLTRALGELPRVLGTVLFGALVALAACEWYLLPLARAVGHGASAIAHHQGALKLVLAALELAVTGALVWLHLAVFASRGSGPS